MFVRVCQFCLRSSATSACGNVTPLKSRELVFFRWLWLDPERERRGGGGGGRGGYFFLRLVNVALDVVVFQVSIISVNKKIVQFRVNRDR